MAGARLAPAGRLARAGRDLIAWTRIGRACYAYIVGRALERAWLRDEELLAIARGRNPEDVGQIVQSMTMYRRPLVFKGTRIPITALYNFLDDGLTVERFLWGYPDLEIADVEAALAHREQTKAA